MNTSVQSRNPEGFFRAWLRDCCDTSLRSITRIFVEKARSRNLKTADIVIVGRLPLGAGKSVILIEVGNSRFLIAAGTESIHSMIKIEGDSGEQKQSRQRAQ